MTTVPNLDWTQNSPGPCAGIPGPDFTAFDLFDNPAPGSLGFVGPYYGQPAVRRFTGSCISGTMRWLVTPTGDVRVEIF